MVSRSFTWPGARPNGTWFVELNTPSSQPGRVGSARRRLLWTAVLLAAALPAAQPLAQDHPAQTKRPNFLVIVADDVGYSDLGFMGSEIRTPNLDALAAGGLLLRNFHVSPACSPTRAMLLSGTDAHPAGLGTMQGEQSPAQLGQTGYEGFLSDRVVSIARLLSDAGYHSYLSGKWHLGSAPGQQPLDRGFEHAYGPLGGGMSHFSDGVALFSSGGPPARAMFLRDRDLVTNLPDNWFSTEAFTDRLIENIEADRADGRPFFALATYTAPHWPLHATQAFIDRYRGVYDRGWDTLRAQRVAALKSGGHIPVNTPVPERLGWVEPWDALSDEQRAQQARIMEIYAAMVEQLDHNIGRLLAYLDETGLRDNTVVLFFSDNGAEGNPVNRIVDDHDWVETHFDNRLENIGRQGSYVFTGPGWAQASTAPFGLFKTFPSEGGIRAPALVSGPGVTPGVSDAFVRVKDIAPTLLELADVPRPGTRFEDRAIAPMTGVSMQPLFSNSAANIHDATTVTVWELFGRRAVRIGDWKAVWLYEPYGPARWQLYNLATDPSETTDLAVSQPAQLDRMLSAWQEYQERYQVVLPAVDHGYAREDDWRLTE